MWFPQSYQLRAGHNPNYLNSVWIGITTPILSLPFVLWRVIVRPMLFGTFSVVSFIILTPIFGLMGRLLAVDEPMPQIQVFVGRFIKRDEPPKP